MTNTQNQETTTIQMSEADMKSLVRNALMVAGQEMGETGDHWPVIKNTIKDVMRDWEDLEIERAVHAEMKTHLYEQLGEMEKLLAVSSPEIKADIGPRLAELREVYDAFFDEVNEDSLYLADNDDLYLDDIEKPAHIRRAEVIVETLMEDEND